MRPCRMCACLAALFRRSDRRRRRGRGFHRFAFLAIAGVFLWEMHVAVAKTAPTAQHFNVVAMCVCLALLGFVFLDRPARDDLQELIATVLEKGGRVVQNMGPFGGVFGGGGLTIEPPPAALDVADELPPPDER